MTTLTGKTPTPAQLAAAHKARFETALREGAGADGRLSLPEAQRIAERDGPEWLISDNAVDFLESSGQKTVSAEKLIGVVHDDMLASASAAAGPNQRLSLLEARSLPANLSGDFLFLRGKGEPERVQPADLRSWAKATVEAALDAESATRLPGPPWQVRGKRPLVENIPHPATSTRATVYLADDQLYFSRAAPAGPGVALVGWYHAGTLPPELQG